MESIQAVSARRTIVRLLSAALGDARAAEAQLVDALTRVGLAELPDRRQEIRGFVRDTLAPSIPDRIARTFIDALIEDVDAALDDAELG
ncbi:MAG: hypothetical protein ACHREM_20450, partial [Polyangiales bacterium]